MFMGDGARNTIPKREITPLALLLVRKQFLHQT